MANELIRDRGRGPELAGTRITVYNLLPYFLDPTATEAYVCKLYALAPEQVAAMRAYVFHNLESVLKEHLRIEERIATGNPPEAIGQALQTRETMKKFEQWLDQRKQDVEEEDAGMTSDFPTFREWFANRDSGKAVEVS